MSAGTCHSAASASPVERAQSVWDVEGQSRIKRPALKVTESYGMCCRSSRGGQISNTVV